MSPPSSSSSSPSGLSVTNAGSTSSPRTRSSSLTTSKTGPSASIRIPVNGQSARSGSLVGMGKQLTPSSSPEPGSSPRALAVAGWQSLVDENSELRTGLVTGEEGIRLIEDEGDDEEDDESEDETAFDVFAISDSQHEYYVKQFLSLQPDMTGVVSGAMVKSFFEKSALDVADLAHIWYLCDYDQSGCLNLNKWCVAMHLTVLRRNGVDLPDILPPVLFAAAVHGHDEKSVRKNLVVSKKCSPVANNNTTRSHQHLIPSLASSSSSSCDPELHLNHQNNSHSWTKFSDSPTNTTTASHSQPAIPAKQPQYQNCRHQPLVASQTPANFDFNASSIETNPEILHPIPLRLTPEAQVMFKSLTDYPSNSKNSSVQSKASSSGFMVPPPPPPPRPSRQSTGHARSSSLDLNRLGGSRSNSFLSSDHQSNYQQRHHNSLSNCYTGKAPAPLPPLPSHPVSPPQSVSPVIHLSDQWSHGAFTVFRKRTNTGSGVLHPPPKPTTSSAVSQSASSADLEDLITSLRTAYSIPHETFIPADPTEVSELLRCLKGLSERNMRIERMNDRLITEMAILKLKNQRLELLLTQTHQTKR